jgi:hypothetical protein
MVSDASAKPKEDIICEEVERSKSVVPQHVLDRVFHRLGLWENDQRMQVAQFAHVRQKSADVLSFLKDDKKNESKQQESKPKQRARKKKPDPEPAT